MSWQLASHLRVALQVLNLIPGPFGRASEHAQRPQDRIALPLPVYLAAAASGSSATESVPAIGGALYPARPASKRHPMSVASAGRELQAELDQAFRRALAGAIVGTGLNGLFLDHRASLVEQALGAIERENPRLNAFVWVYPQGSTGGGRAGRMTRARPRGASDGPGS